MSEIPKASLKLMDLKTYFASEDGGTEGYAKWSDIPALLIDFATLHVEAALQAASIYGNLREDSFGPEDILKSYPLENIK